MKDKIREYFKNNQNEIRTRLLSILAELIKVKSVNPGNDKVAEYPYLDVAGDESKVVNVLKPYFDEMGFTYETYELVKGRENILVGYGEGEKSLCIGCHLDIVPAGDESQWNTDPFQMVEKDGIVYGRGVLDNKGPTASSMVALELLKKLGIQLNGRLIFAGIAGEEFTEKDEPDPGIEFLLEKGHLKPDYAIIPDIGENMKVIDVAEKGRMVLNVTSFGKQAHGSTPEHGINAIANMAEFLTRVEKMELQYNNHQVLGRPTVNLGLLSGGSAANIVPASCKATFDIRYVPGQTAEGIKEEFAKCANGITNGKFEFEIESNEVPHEMNPNNELVETIKVNTQDVLGFTPETVGLGGRSFAKPFNIGGILAVGFGPGDEEAFHVSNEYQDIEQLVQFAELISCIAIDLLGTKN